MSGFFGLLAAALAAVGLYGSLAHAAASRARGIGIASRNAPGAAASCG